MNWDELKEYVKRYFEFRGYKWPDSNQAYLFLVSEVGELADVLNQRSSSDWVRNHPDMKHVLVENEVSDILMMLTAFCIAENIDPFEAMQNKFKNKGFPG